MSVSLIQDHMRRKNEQSPQYDFLWRVELPSVGESPIDTTSGGGNEKKPSKEFDSWYETQLNQLGLSRKDAVDKPTTGNEMQHLDHRVYSIDVPFYSYETHKANAAPGYFYTAHHRDIGTLNLTMDEYEDGLTLKYLNDWTKLIKRDDGTYNPPSMYKKTIRYIRMSATKLDLHISTYKGFFLSEVSPLNASQESDGIMQYSITLTGDKVEHKIIPASEVLSKISEAEAEILRQEIPHSKFALGGIDGMAKSRAFDRMIDMIG